MLSASKPLCHYLGGGGGGREKARGSAYLHGNRLTMLLHRTSRIVILHVIFILLLCIIRLLCETLWR